MEAQHAFQVNLNLPQAVKFCFIPPAAVQQGLLEIGGDIVKSYGLEKLS